jgi:hypothetical protein
MRQLIIELTRIKTTKREYIKIKFHFFFLVSVFKTKLKTENILRETLKLKKITF